MDLILKYNKDKTKLKVDVNVPVAKWAVDERIYTTDDVVEALANLDVAVTKKQCIQGGRLYNWTGQTSGTWRFVLENKTTQPEVKKADTKLAPKAEKESPVNKTKTVKKPTAKTKRASSTKDVLSRLKKV